MSYVGPNLTITDAVVVPQLLKADFLAVATFGGDWEKAKKRYPDSKITTEQCVATEIIDFFSGKSAATGEAPKAPSSDPTEFARQLLELLTPATATEKTSILEKIVFPKNDNLSLAYGSYRRRFMEVHALLKPTNKAAVKAIIHGLTATILGPPAIHFVDLEEDATVVQLFDFLSKTLIQIIALRECGLTVFAPRQITTSHWSPPPKATTPAVTAKAPTPPPSPTKEAVKRFCLAHSLCVRCKETGHTIAQCPNQYTLLSEKQLAEAKQEAATKAPPTPSSPTKQKPNPHKQRDPVLTRAKGAVPKTTDNEPASIGTIFHLQLCEDLQAENPTTSIYEDQKAADPLCTINPQTPSFLPASESPPSYLHNHVLLHLHRDGDNQTEPVKILIDSGSFASCIRKDYAVKLGLEIQPPTRCRMVSGASLESPPEPVIGHTICQLQLTPDTPVQQISLVVLEKSPFMDIILFGLPDMIGYNISFKTNTPLITFDKPFTDEPDPEERSLPDVIMELSQDSTQDIQFGDYLTEDQTTTVKRTVQTHSDMFQPVNNRPADFLSRSHPGLPVQKDNPTDSILLIIDQCLQQHLSDSVKDPPHTLESGIIRLKEPPPDDIIRKIFAHAHCAFLSGHPGTQQTVRNVKTTISWPGCSTTITRMVQQCPTCQKINAVPPKLSEPGSTAAYLPFDSVFMDFIGPFPKTALGNKHIFVVTDRFSHFTILNPVPDTKAPRAAENFYRNWICTVASIPRLITSDGGKAFTSTCFQSLVRILQTEHHISSPHHAEGHGAVEARNKFVEKILRAFVDKNPNWDTLLPAVQFVVNTTYSRMLAASPFQILHGYAPTIPLQSAFGLAPRKNISSKSQFLDLVVDAADQARSVVTTINQHVDENNTRVAKALAHGVAQYEPEDLVLIRFPRASKLEREWEGPFLVRGKITDLTNTYEVFDFVHQTTFRSHASRMVPFRRGLLTDAELSQIAIRQNEQLIEKVSEHRGVNPQLEFHVKWALHEPANSQNPTQWMSYADCRFSPAVKAYCLQHGLHPTLH